MCLSSAPPRKPMDLALGLLVLPAGGTKRVLECIYIYIYVYAYIHTYI